jgi:hypothetical protein
MDGARHADYGFQAEAVARLLDPALSSCAPTCLCFVLVRNSFSDISERRFCIRVCVGLLRSQRASKSPAFRICTISRFSTRVPPVRALRLMQAACLADLCVCSGYPVDHPLVQGWHESQHRGAREEIRGTLLDV